ncbi:MAG: protease modulator HflC [Deltaproteobacteria bacterium]|nr:MAG: protease modulator HflC [Deltaproteobacteria bacterium]TNF24851.1 MAG: protease modulator HflC [Deltaproteobacteria bacterium]
MGKTISIIVTIVVVIVLKTSLFVVTEGKQVIITQFGRPIGEPITTAGLHFKKPFLQEARFVDKRILSWDGFPNQIPTKDKKYISVDTTARWRIVDALKFIQTVQNERGAKARLDAILDATTRDVISNHNLVEAVRLSNSILDSIARKKKEIEDKEARGEAIVEEEITGEIEKVTTGREELSKMIAESADKELGQFGIKLIDVQLRRISYEESVEKKVYERMISERQRIAEKIKSIGQGEKAKIEGRLSKDLRKIQSEAYRKAEEIKGKAEGLATSIYAKSFNMDPKFYEFIRSMDAYKKSLKSDGKFILSSDSEFLKYLKND